ncbi:MAG: hypothetical protein KJN76_08365 [Eudoraea sp.]|nr:hypothetical protein [Eudoraea sp.]
MEYSALYLRLFRIGLNSDLHPLMVTTANTENHGGEVIRAAAGANLLLANDQLLLSLEAGVPVYQKYNGIFMDEDLGVHIALRYNVL